MGPAEKWMLVECACRVLGVSTAAVLCAVGVETLREGKFYNLAIYLLVASGVLMLFELAYFVDAILIVCLPCPPQWIIFILWKKLANMGGFQKFLYYTIMSVVCFLHPVLMWHAVIPGTMLLFTGLSYFILSKRKTKVSPMTASIFEPHSVEAGSTGPAYSQLHLMGGRRATALALVYSPSTEWRQGAGDVQQARVEFATAPDRMLNKRHVNFTENRTGGTEDGTEEDRECGDLEPEDVTSDKAPMIRT